MPTRKAKKHSQRFRTACHLGLNPPCRPADPYLLIYRYLRLAGAQLSGISCRLSIVHLAPGDRLGNSRTGEDTKGPLSLAIDCGHGATFDDIDVDQGLPHVLHRAHGESPLKSFHGGVPDLVGAAARRPGHRGVKRPVNSASSKVITETFVGDLEAYLPAGLEDAPPAVRVVGQDGHGGFKLPQHGIIAFTRAQPSPACHSKPFRMND